MSPYVSESSTHPHKRVRFSPSATSSSPSSALASTSTPGTSSITNASDYNSTNNSESDISTSSEEPSSDSSSEEDSDEDGDTEMSEQVTKDGVVNLIANRGKKPVMRLGADEDLGPDIREFLKDFLPQLKASNEELERQKKAGTLKSIDAPEEEEGKEYIERDLGLGVLEEKDPDKSIDVDSDAEDGRKEKDILGKLMGREKKDPAGIEVVQNNTTS